MSARFTRPSLARASQIAAWSLVASWLASGCSSRAKEQAPNGGPDSGTTGADTGVVPDPSLKLTIVSGDGQSAVAGTELSLPLVVRLTDRAGAPVQGISVLWIANVGGGAVSEASTTTRIDGTASVRAILGAARGENTISAAFLVDRATGGVSFHAQATGGLAYVAPPDVGKIRLVQADSGTSTGAVTLQLIAAVELSGYSVGFSLPVDPNRIRLAPGGFEPGPALPPGASPAAAKGVIATRGRLRDMLVTGQSQKAAGEGAITEDARVPAGAVFYTIQLELAPGALPGVAFDGLQPGARFRGGMRDRSGSEVVAAGEVAIGRLEVR